MKTSQQQFVGGIENGWLANIRQCHSPNFNERPADTTINLLVIHNISLPPEQFGGGYIEAFFCNQLDYSVHSYFQTIDSLQVSAHLLINREGEIIQFVPFDKRAWHAGESIFNGVANCNDYSIGIELEGSDHIPYTEKQYAVLAAVTESLQQAYPAITMDNIVGHSDIAPSRKTDPGSAFKWAYFRALLTNG